MRASTSKNVLAFGSRGQKEKYPTFCRTLDFNLFIGLDRSLLYIAVFRARLHGHQRLQSISFYVACGI